MRILELFAGYGSQALALENLGIEFTSDISEIDKYAIQAYNQLHGDTHNWGDITKINENELPYYDLITYSSPCQDFSVAGLGKGGDAGSGTRSSLLWEVERIIRAVKPKYLLMENVKNLVGERHKHNFIRWLRVLEMMGYQNFWKVLNAKDYGVPQNRERVFVVSILGGGQYLFPNPIKLEKRLKDVLEPVVDEKYYLSQDKVDKLVMNMDKEVSNTIRCGGGSLDGKHTWDIVACASRGRENSSDRTAGSPTEQRLEVNQTGCSNTLTSVQKDNYLLEPQVLTPKRNEYGKAVRKEYETGNFTDSRHNMTDMQPRIDGVSNTLTTVEKDNYLLEPLHIKENTQKGFADAYEGDSVSLDQPNSTTRRGRVGNQISNTLTCSCNTGVVQLGREPKILDEQNGYIRKDGCVGTLTTDGSSPKHNNRVIVEMFNPYNNSKIDDIAPTQTSQCDHTTTSSSALIKYNNYRIRKLTPRECWRLMGVRDEQFDKLHDISNSQLYKLAGNSIVVDVLMGIFKNLLLSDERTSGQLTLL